MKSQRMVDVLRFLSQFPPNLYFRVTGENEAEVLDTTPNVIGFIDFSYLTFTPAYGYIVIREGKKITQITKK